MKSTFIAEFIIILFVFIIVVYTKYVLDFSTTVLGKIVSLSVVLYYTSLNKVYGLLAAAILIYVHHQGYILQQSKEGFDKDDFMKAHCKSGKLKYKTSTVNAEMAEHVFPEIKYNYPENRCHPCDPSCEYTIIEEKLTKEEELLMPKHENEHAIPEKTILDYWKLPFASIGVKTEPFSYL